MSLQKESNLRRKSIELHTECKCAPGTRLNSLPKLRRDNIFQKRRRDPKSSGLIEEECIGFLRIHEFAEGIKLKRNSAELHAELKCAPGMRLTSLPNLRRDSIFQKHK